MATSRQYLTEYEKAQKRYQDLVSGQNKFTELVKQKLGEKTDYNRDLITQQNQLAENQLSLPSQLRSEFSTGPVRNPLQQEALIQSRQSALGSSVGSIADLLAARGQREQDILSSGANVYGNMLQGAGTAVENAWRLYQDRLAQEQAARARAAAGGGLDLSSLFGAGGGGSGKPAEELAIEIGEDKPLGDRALDLLSKVRALTGNKSPRIEDALLAWVEDPKTALQLSTAPLLRSLEKGGVKGFTSTAKKGIQTLLNSLKRK